MLALHAQYGVHAAAPIAAEVESACL